MPVPTTSALAEQNFLVVVAGCTGTGKSDLGVEIAKKFDGEVINADSMQLYKGLDIVTNKITDEEAQGIPHHLIGFLEPADEFNVHKFQEKCLECLNDIWSRRKLPVIVGGTAYYIESVIYKDSIVKVGSVGEVENLREETKNKTTEELYQMLKDKDPQAAAQVHPNNRARVQRSLEICTLGNSNKNDLIGEQGKLSFPNTALFILDADTEVLDNRLDGRVDKMEAKGLMKELTDFYTKYGESLKSHGIKQSIGIKEFLPYLNLPEDERETKKGEKIKKRCADVLKINTRKYARKQRNWFTMRFVRRTELREVPNLIVLNTSTRFFEQVVPFALQQLETFFQTSEFDKSIKNSCVIDTGDLVPITDPNYAQKANQMQHCEVCKRDIHGEVCWQRHLMGKKHLYNVSSYKLSLYRFDAETYVSKRKQSTVRIFPQRVGGFDKVLWSIFANNLFAYFLRSIGFFCIEMARSAQQARRGKQRKADEQQQQEEDSNQGNTTLNESTASAAEQAVQETPQKKTEEENKAAEEGKDAEVEVADEADENAPTEKSDEVEDESAEEEDQENKDATTTEAGDQELAPDAFTKKRQVEEAQGEGDETNDVPEKKSKVDTEA
ncbi:unnamed protein product [Bursaphelenchus xylophilus]|uniref:(pine wood nematode) hypothetical protein n=1 Tax=Bursaphelenchus xylophilus TaxID=6326 RepID=A0A1I7SD23_BURXY|nr:unnamed protein product [Bursaphelenchus xylophilus]CAG9093068.1 unnamed protein product [Bursaphelenchus xylophilus]